MAGENIFDIFAAILAISASIYFFFIASKVDKGFKTGFILLGIGSLITIGVHSILSILSRLGYLEMIVVMASMTIQIYIGVGIIIWGANRIYKEIMRR